MVVFLVLLRVSVIVVWVIYSWFLRTFANVLRIRLCSVRVGVDSVWITLLTLLRRLVVRTSCRRVRLANVHLFTI